MTHNGTVTENARLNSNFSHSPIASSALHCSHYTSLFVLKAWDLTKHKDYISFFSVHPAPGTTNWHREVKKDLIQKDTIPVLKPIII